MLKIWGGRPITHSYHDEQRTALVNRRNGRHWHNSPQRTGERPPSCLQIKAGVPQLSLRLEGPGLRQSETPRPAGCTARSTAPPRVWVHRPGRPAALRGPQQAQRRSRTHPAAGPQSPGRPAGRRGPTVPGGVPLSPASADGAGAGARAPRSHHAYSGLTSL